MKRWTLVAVAIAVAVGGIYSAKAQTAATQATPAVPAAAAPAAPATPAAPAAPASNYQARSADVESVDGIVAAL